MTVELYMIDKLKARIQLARQIDAAQHKTKKKNHEKRWLREAAEAMEIELGSDLDMRCGGNSMFASAWEFIFDIGAYWYQRR